MATLSCATISPSWAAGVSQTGSKHVTTVSAPCFVIPPACQASLSSHRLAPSRTLLPGSFCSRNFGAHGVAEGLGQGCRQRSRSLAVRAKATKVDKSVVIPEPDYRLALSCLGIAGALALVAKAELLAAPFGLLGALLLVQTTRVKFVFDKETLSVLIGEELESSGENTFVGGENRWRFDTFTNWEFWWPNFPVLVFFKETQTKPEGQIHFFPVILNGKQLYEVMVERCGPSKTSGPK